MQIAVGVCLIVIIGGTVAYLSDGRISGEGIAVLALAYAMIFTIAKRVWVHSHIAPPEAFDDTSGERIVELEKRLSDVQKIVIAIDEKLTRLIQETASLKG